MQPRRYASNSVSGARPWRRRAKDRPQPAVKRLSRDHILAMRQGLIVAGLVLVMLGIAWPWLGRIGLGHLPGDIRLRWPGGAFDFPLGTSLLLSIVLSLALGFILWLFRR